MLLLSRKKGDTSVIGNGISVAVLDLPGSRVRLGIEAPAEIPVHRKEVEDSIGSAPVLNRWQNNLGDEYEDEQVAR